MSGSLGSDSGRLKWLERYKTLFIFACILIAGIFFHAYTSQIQNGVLPSPVLIPIDLVPVSFYSKVGDSLIIAALLGATYEWFTKEVRQQQFRQFIETELDTDKSDEDLVMELSQSLTDEYQIFELITEFGIQRAYGSRGPEQMGAYEEQLDKLEESIDIIGFGLRTFRQDWGEEFEEWASKARVRVLLIDPMYPNDSCSYADQRDTEEGGFPDTIKKDVRKFVQDTSHLIKDDDTDFDVRLYTCLPSVTVFRIDDMMFWGPYTIGKKSRQMPIFLVDSQGELYHEFADHFEKIWGDCENGTSEFSRSVPEEWLE